MMYSMGNFVTNERQELCKHTGILQLMLRRESGKITVQEYFIPCYVFDEICTGRFSVVPVDELLNGGIGCEKLEQARDYIRNWIGPDLAELPSGAITLAKACAKWNKAFLVSDERELEKAILAQLQEGDSILLNAGRSMNFNITLRRIFGLTDGFIPDAW